MRRHGSGKLCICVAALLVAIGLPFATSGCGNRTEKEVQPEMSDITLQGKSVLMIIASQNFRDEEFARPKSILENAGADVTVASSSIEEATGMLGKVSVTPDVTIDRVAPADYDAVVFVGGSGASEYWDNPTAHEIATRAHEEGKIVAAICIAPVTLARAGLLDGKKATVFNSEVENLKREGAVYTGAAVERDGNIITADGPQSAEEFGLALKKALARG